MTYSYPYRRLNIFYIPQANKTVEDMIPDDIIMVNEYHTRFWIKFIKDIAKEKYPQLFIIENSIRENTIDDGLEYFDNEDSVKNYILR